jgi:hypothetical protein
MLRSGPGSRTGKNHGPVTATQQLLCSAARGGNEVRSEPAQCRPILDLFLGILFKALVFVFLKLKIKYDEIETRKFFRDGRSGGSPRRTRMFKSYVRMQPL